MARKRRLSSGSSEKLLRSACKVFSSHATKSGNRVKTLTKKLSNHMSIKVPQVGEGMQPTGLSRLQATTNLLALEGYSYKTK